MLKIYEEAVFESCKIELWCFGQVGERQSGLLNLCYCTDEGEIQRPGLSSSTS